MRIHLHLPRLASCLFWPIAKSGFKSPSLWSAVFDLIFPRVCAGCGSEPDVRGHICWECRTRLTFITDDFCAVCGDPVEGVAGHAFKCSACVDRMPHFDLARSAVRYSGPARRAMQSFKYQGATHLRKDLAFLLLGCVRAHYPGIHFDAVTFVPLYPRRQRARAYNQSKLLAGEVASGLGIALARNCLRRVRDTRTQTDLSAAQRRENVRGAFEVLQLDWTRGRTFLLIDDVMTTGATVNECARALKAAYAAGVYVATVARG